MRDLWQDLRYGARSLVQSPTFTIIAVLTLALAMGVNSAIFSMVSVFFLSDLPMKDGDTLSFVFARNPERGLVRQDLSLPDFLDLRDGVDAFEGLGAMGARTVVLTGADEPARILIGETTSNLFDVWGTDVVMGRAFLPGEDEPGAERVAMLSHGTWERRFGSDPQILGTTVRLDGFETTIVGVVDEAMEVGDLARFELWRPVVIERAGADRARRDFWAMGRLREGATLDQAVAQVAAISTQLRNEYPTSNGGWELYAQSFASGLASDSFWTILTLLGVTVSLVMLIACSNVANMMLARASARGREIAVRAALGAGRLRILRQLLTESALLSVAAGLLGLVVARLSLNGLIWIVGDASGLSFFFRSLAIDHNVFGFALIVSVLTPLIFGLTPAVRSSRLNLGDALKEGGRTAGRRSALRGRRILVTAQVSLALALMMVAGVLIRAMIAERSVAFPYDGEQVLTLRIELPTAEYPEEAQQRQMFRELVARVRGLPGVESAAWTSNRPNMGPERPRSTSFLIQGRPLEDPDRMPWAGIVATEPEYFDLLNLGLSRGRNFDRRDNANSMPVAVINQAVADLHWPGEDPVGQRFRRATEESDAPWTTIIGVVATIPDAAPDIAPRPLIYVPFEQGAGNSLGLLVQTSGSPLALAPSVRDEVWAIDPDQPVDDIRTLAQIADDDQADSSALLSMFIAFAVFALVLASGGIYGVLSFSVAQRRQEFGVRMALGGHSAAVRTMVMRQSSAPIFGGVALGLMGGYLLNSMLASGFSGVNVADPAVYGIVAAVLTSVALLSAYVPARRATKVDPMIALRTE